MLAATAGRVEGVTPLHVNLRIHKEIEENVYENSGGDHAIQLRLTELDQEWDVERMLETMASSMTLLGLVLGRKVDRRWYALPAGVASMLLLHAVQGWCPPLPVLRRLGFRTAREIDAERYALKALRGDFDHIRRMPSGDERFRAALAVEAAEA